MSQHNESKISPASPQSLQPGRHFVASYAGERVAGTEFPPEWTPINSGQNGRR